MSAYRVVILPHIEDRLRGLPPDVKRGVREAIRSIGLDPAKGEPLRGELRGCMKFRVRRFRVVYSVARDRRAVIVLAVGHRRSVYEEFAARLRSEKA